MVIKNPPWTRDELILALELYFRFNPSHISASHPEVVQLSKILNDLTIHTNRPDATRFRNPNSVYMNLCNFLRLDPAYTGTGLQAGSKKDKEVWKEFANNHERLRAVAEAIRKSGEFSNIGYAFIDEEDEAPEGEILFRLHKSRECSTSLIRKKKVLSLQKHGYIGCDICGFVFNEYYGSLGDGFIECHHTMPISQLRPGESTKLKELALVCANCHRMLHRGGDLLTIAKLQEIVQANTSRETQ